MNLSSTMQHTLSKLSSTKWKSILELDCDLRTIIALQMKGLVEVKRELPNKELYYRKVKL